MIRDITDHLSQLRVVLEKPSIVARYLNRVIHLRGFTQNHNLRGIDIFEKDWDSLIILDACRYDIFEQHFSGEGELSRVESRGSNTVGFLRGNLDQKNLQDTIYVTANPQFYRHKNELEVDFFDVVNVWKDEGWDDEEQTVLPETVTNVARRVHSDYPNKRILVHYIQPHYPFIGNDLDDKGHLEDEDPEKLNIWMKLFLGRSEIPEDELWAAYVENLQIALPHVYELVNNIDGKVVVTSDHGNMFGESASPIGIKEWGHPWGVHTEELVNVPWFELEYETRRRIKSGPSKRDRSTDTIGQDVNERLKKLGYK